MGFAKFLAVDHSHVRSRVIEFQLVQYLRPLRIMHMPLNRSKCATARCFKGWARRESSKSKLNARMTTRAYGAPYSNSRRLFEIEMPNYLLKDAWVRSWNRESQNWWRIGLQRISSLPRLNLSRVLAADESKLGASTLIAAYILVGQASPGGCIMGGHWSKLATSISDSIQIKNRCRRLI